MGEGSSGGEGEGDDKVGGYLVFVLLKGCKVGGVVVKWCWILMMLVFMVKGVGCVEVMGCCSVVVVYVCCVIFFMCLV